jgi:hypothetical protein
MGEKAEEKRCYFDFSFPYLYKSVKTKNFVNMLADEKEFCKQHKILQELLLELGQKSIAENLQQKHNHVIDDRNKRALVYEVVKALYDNNKNYTQMIDDEELYNLGLKQGLRLICLLKGNIIKPLFIDYYHCIYADEKHNNKCIDKNEFSPYYKGGR